MVVPMIQSRDYEHLLIIDEITEDQTYKDILERISQLLRLPGILRTELNEDQAKELNYLVDLVEEYEERKYPI